MITIINLISTYQCKSCRYGYKLKKVLESSWKQLWSHLGGRKGFRKHLAMLCQYRSKNGGYRPKKESIKAPENPQISHLHCVSLMNEIIMVFNTWLIRSTGFACGCLAAF